MPARKQEQRHHFDPGSLVEQLTLKFRSLLRPIHRKLEEIMATKDEALAELHDLVADAAPVG